MPRLIGTLAGGRSRTTERNLANNAAQSPISDAGHDLKPRQDHNDAMNVQRLKEAFDQASRDDDSQ